MSWQERWEPHFGLIFINAKGGWASGGAFLFCSIVLSPLFDFLAYPSCDILVLCPIGEVRPTPSRPNEGGLVLKFDLEEALARDGEVEDLPLTGDDQVAKDEDVLPCSPGSSFGMYGHQLSIVRGQQALNLVERVHLCFTIRQ
ncbi:hypothetical protein BHE74_00057823 [Ensete ventricosum]|nr:hypothetical protein BHE74_00057823 [Ensete ventricosum]